MSNRLLWIFIILSSMVCIFADKNIDQKIQELEKKIENSKGKEKVDIFYELSYTYQAQSPKKTIEFAKKGLELSKKIKYHIGEAKALRLLGNGYSLLAKNDQALNFYNESLKICKDLADKKEIASTLNNLGNVYADLSKNQKAMECYNRSLNIRRELNDKKGIADILNNLGNMKANHGDLDKALEDYQQSLKIREELGSEKDIAASFSNIGNIYEHLGDLEKSLEYHHKSLNLKRRIGDTKGISISTNNIGLAYWRLAKYDQAIDYFLQSLKISEEIDDKRGAAICLHNLGLIYGEIENLQESLAYNQKALKIFKEIDFKYAIGASLDNIGNIYDGLKEYDKSLNYHLEALKIREEIGDKEGIATSLSNAGNRYKTLKKYKEALKYYNRSLSINRKIGSKSGMANTLTNLAGLYTKQGNYKKGFQHLKQALAFSKEIKENSLVQIIYKGYSDFYYDLKQYKSAYEYFKKHSEIKDKIINEESKNKIAELQTKYETEKKEKEIALLKKNSKIQELELKGERLKSTLFIIGFILVLMLLIILVWLYIRLRKFWKRKNFIGHFKIVKKIGGGSIGEVFKAVNITDKSQPVALKVINEEHKDDQRLRNRFKNEAVIIDQLDHPNIVKVYERGEFNKRPYIAMELLEGHSLEEIINQGNRLSIKDSLVIMHQLASALTAIHEKGVYHCDIKPGNIMLTETEEQKVYVKLLDFDIARSQFISRHTEPGYLMGTIYYLPPEYITRQEKTAASDIYSFGVVCYELLTFERPFLGEGAMEILKQIQDIDPLEPIRYRPDIPSGLNNLIIQMMSKTTEQRPDENELLQKIEELYRREVSND